MNGLDIFSGIAGITKALEGYVTPVAYCENNKYAQAALLSEMYRGGIPIGPIWDDIKTINKTHITPPPPTPKLSMEASLARTSALRAAEKAWEASAADFFSRSSGSRANYDLVSSSWRTSQLLLFGEQSELLGNFAASGMTVAGAFYPLRMWARITDANDGGSWPTPTTAPEADNRGSNKKSGPKSLGAAAKYGGPLWRTPRANDWKGGVTGAKGSKRNPSDYYLPDQVNNPKMWRTPLGTDGEKMGHGNLPHQAAMFPTPAASSYGTNQGGAAGRTGKVRPSLQTMAMQNLWPTPNIPNGGRVIPKDAKWSGKAAYHNGKKMQVGLESAVRRWPTPLSSEGSGGFQDPDKRRSGGHTPKLRDEVGGQLNPTWVEWLMGYRLGWTVLEPWATVWFRPRRGKPLKG